MSVPVPTTEPLELRAGVQWEWRRDDFVENFPATGGWALKYHYKKTGATPGNFSIDASASGAAFVVTKLASDTAAYVAGDYTWVAIVTKATESREVDHGRLKILPRYDQAANLDDRSHARKMLEAINAALEGRASSTQREMIAYTIGQRSKQFDTADSKAALVELKSKYEWLVYNEDVRDRVAQGLPNPRNVGVRFTRP